MKLSEEQAKTHPKKNVLMKAIGTERTIQPDFYKVNIQANSYFLFCTDGLSNKLSEAIIQSILFSTMSLEEKGSILLMKLTVLVEKIIFRLILLI